MKNSLLNKVVLALGVAFSVQVGTFMSFASDLGSIVSEANIESVDKGTSVSDIEKILSSYVGHYEADVDVLISEARKLSRDRGVTNECIELFSACNLDINEDGSGVVLVVLDMDPTEVRACTKMEFVSVTDGVIRFRVKKGDEFVDAVFKREKRDGKQYLVIDKMGMVSYFEKIEKNEKV